MCNSINSQRSSPTHSRPVIAVSMGDPAGVGPELCLKLLARPARNSRVRPSGIPLIVGDYAILQQVARKTRLALTAPRIAHPDLTITRPSVLDLPHGLGGVHVTPGRNQAPCGRAAFIYIKAAVDGCVSGRFAGLVTAPISKCALSLAGVHYPGHTEMIADLIGCARPTMLLYSEKLAVAFVTTHQSLRSVPDAITTERIVEVTTLLNRYVRLMSGKIKPRLAILGLNPHAGEEGLFGCEEASVVAPAIHRLRALGLRVEGPLPPDTAFTKTALARYHGHVALYHDQGSIPFKMFAFEQGVNVTMGLDITRTSPDHGTAFDIAWKGRAQADSFFSAFDLAVRLAQGSQKGKRVLRANASVAGRSSGVKKRAP